MASGFRKWSWSRASLTRDQGITLLLLGWAAVAGCNVGFEPEALPPTDGQGADAGVDGPADTTIDLSPAECRLGTCPSGCTIEWFRLTDWQPVEDVADTRVLAYVTETSEQPIAGAVVVYTRQSGGGGLVGLHAQGPSDGPALGNATELDVLVAGMTGQVASGLIPVTTSTNVVGVDGEWLVDPTATARAPTILSFDAGPPHGRIAVTAALGKQSFAGWIVDHNLAGARVRGGGNAGVERVVNALLVGSADQIVGSVVTAEGNLEVFACAQTGTQCHRVGFDNQSEDGTLPHLGDEPLTSSRRVLRMIDADLRHVGITHETDRVYLTRGVFADQPTAEIALAETASSPTRAAYTTWVEGGSETMDVYVLDGDLTVARVDNIGFRAVHGPEDITPLNQTLVDLSVSRVDAGRTIITAKSADDQLYFGNRLCPTL